MILELATAELGNRLRRAFGLRGRLTTAVDETAFLSVNVADLDRPPWRSEGLAWLGGITQVAVAGQNSYVEFGCASATTDLATIDAILVNNQNAAAVSFNLKPYVSTPPVGGCITTEIPPVSGQAGVDAPVGVAGGSAALSGLVARVTVPVGSSAIIPIPPLVIQPGIVWRVYTAAVNLDVSAAAHGRWWPRQGV